MQTQTEKTSVTFIRPFRLDGIEAVLPAGIYRLESENEVLDGMFLPDCLRPSVLIHLHGTPGDPGYAQTLTVPWAVLEDAILRDRSPAAETLTDPAPAEMQLDSVVQVPGGHGPKGHHPGSEDEPSDGREIVRGPYSSRRFLVNDDPVDLDDRRSTTGRVATNMRRHSLKELEADQESLRRRQTELEMQLLAEPAISWPEAAAKAQYLLRLYAQTAEGQDARRQKLIQRALGDLARLMDRER